jgi:hypothetical protein
VGIAKPVDAYANCFVRRNRPSRNLDADAAAPPHVPPAAPASVTPSRLRLHNLLKPDTSHEPITPDPEPKP